jgi:uncharacterized spore protein YtfJ
MKHVKRIISLLGERLTSLAKGSVVATEPISMGDRHVVALCELSLSVGGGGGAGEDVKNGDKPKGEGIGGGVGGGAKATPVAVVVVDGGHVRIETFGK